MHMHVSGCVQPHVDICGVSETMSHGLGTETYSSNVQGLEGELIHPGTFKIVLQVVVGDQKNLLDGVRFIPVELDVDPRVCAGPRDIPRLQADVVAEVWAVQRGGREGRVSAGRVGRAGAGGRSAAGVGHWAGGQQLSPCSLHLCWVPSLTTWDANPCLACPQGACMPRTGKLSKNTECNRLEGP